MVKINKHTRLSISLSDLHGHDSKWLVNKQVAKIIGLAETVMLIELLAIWDSKGEKRFSVSRNTLFKKTGFSFACQKSYEDKLISLNFLSRKLKGIPPKNRYKVKQKNLDKFIYNPKKYLTRLGIV